MQNNLSAYWNARTPCPKVSKRAGSRITAGYHFEGLRISATSVSGFVFSDRLLSIFSVTQCDSAGLSELLLQVNVTHSFTV